MRVAATDVEVLRDHPSGTWGRNWTRLDEEEEEEEG